MSSITFVTFRRKKHNTDNLDQSLFGYILEPGTHEAIKCLPELPHQKTGNVTIQP